MGLEVSEILERKFEKRKEDNNQTFDSTHSANVFADYQDWEMYSYCLCLLHYNY